MFDPDQAAAAWTVLETLPTERVKLLSLDEEGSGHCSCGQHTPREHCQTTFIQVCVWPVDAPPMVFMDYFPTTSDWVQRIAAVAPHQPVATWSDDPLAARFFGASRVIDLQQAAAAAIIADLRLTVHGLLGLKPAYAWVAHRRGERVVTYKKPKEVHKKVGCWQRGREYYTERHRLYAAADAYATAALLDVYLDSRV